MKINTIVTPSSQVDSTLPLYIAETYKQFVKFMTFADESEERLGFSQDLLQNLQKYRDFATYEKKVVQFGVLAANISATDTELTLEDSYGFPEENGIVYIDNEVILYRKKEGNKLTELERGASGTVILPTFTAKGTYVDSVAADHTLGSSVQNLSVLFLVGFLKTIYESYAPDINPERVAPEINNATFLENIRDFFQSKGSKLGIKALFKILFAENDVDVSYPGDRMIIPSKSTWSESQILRTTPQPRSLVNPAFNYVVPTEMMNSVITLRSYNDEKVYARSICDYVSSYPYEDTIQYEMYLNKDKNTGGFIANPVTRLTRALGAELTITVESTLGYPESGILFIGTEGITYTSKTWNQFLGCKRGVKGYSIPHSIDTKVYGPYYIQSEVILEGITYTSVSYPLGLVKDINIVDGGLLHTKKDTVYVNGPGRVDPREPALASFIENYDEQLVTQAQSAPDLTEVTNYTAGVDGVYFDADYVFISSSGFPYYSIGKFSDNGTIGKNMKANPSTWVIPRAKRNNPDILLKGTDEIGISVDGVPIYSDVSPANLTQGYIEDFKVINRGSAYINPTVILDPPLSTAEATVVNGQITSILQTSVANYTVDPTVRISSGEGATFNITFDNYGRLSSVTINEAGEYYKDVPSLRVVDATGRGTGAVLSCTVANGEIETVTIVNTGIDYNPLTTAVETSSVGSGAVVTASTQKYSFNRYQEVLNQVNWTFDSGNGFVWGDNASPPIELDTFGYVCNPTQLRTQLEDDGTKHSPILGWAFDGNPIYGPYGFTNTKNNSGGIERQRSGYTLKGNRDGLGSNPPAVGPYNLETGVYPMGTFTQDFEYQPASASDIFIITEAGLDITNQAGEDISTDSGNIGVNVLDENNGRICNTPEYPEELYPNGIYAYFLTVNPADTAPEFPYYIGTTFHNRPLSQINNLETSDISSDTLKSAEYSPSSYDTTEVSFNIDLVERFRNQYLNETKDDISLEIADVTEGSVSSILVENGLPATTKTGDILYYPDPDEGGNGAEGVVTFVTGQDITLSQGQLVQTYLRSHRQIINLSSYLGTDSFVFVEGTTIYETSGAIGTVNKWDTSNYLLEVQCLTYYLFKYSNPDTPLNPYYIYDNRGTAIKVMDKPTTLYTGPPGQNLLGSSRPNRVIMAEGAPSLGIGGIDPEPGDIAWSVGNGRMYIYYDDGNTTAWVESQPVGMIPVNEYASDTGVGTTAATSQVVLNTGENNTVTISTTFPDQRSDGTPNRMGDLWWSQQTGILYIWYTDLSGSSQWVMTEPSATVPGTGAIDELYPELPNAVNRGNIYTRSIVVTISDVAPSTHSDGTAIVVGDLWWCSSNGKTYIYYEDTPGTATNSVQWVQCNPVGSVTTQYGEDEPINPIPPGPTPPEPVPPNPGPDPDPYPGGDMPVLPEKQNQRLLWFRDMTNFLPTDRVEFPLGLPGQEELTEVALIDEVGTPDNANGSFNRGFGDDPLELPDGTNMINDTRAVYVVNTSAAHDLIPGDIVFFENSSFDEINDVHTVARAGQVIPGSIGVTIDITTGKVTALTILDRGNYYTKSFVISFTGGGGQGAYGFATVSPIELGGGIESVEILEAGSNYIESPTPILGDELTNLQFEIYVKNFYPDDNNNVKYSANGEAVESTAAYIGTTSGGVGYKSIPPASGLIKKEGDRASFKINGSRTLADGQSINTVEVVIGGSRYVNPTAIFGDRGGSGSGASADVTVSNGVVTAVTVTDGGSGYIEPVITLVEEDGKFISLTRDIGKITAGTVINPGRDISVDRSLRPELQITTRCIISYINQDRGPFAVGSEVFQGTTDYKLVTAIVVDYDDTIQQLTLEKVNGVLRVNEVIQDNYGTTANVLLEGEADCRALVSGTSEPKGVFINDTSKLSTKYAVVQDSKKYQWFSYEIASRVQRNEYENFVNDIVHPTGFAMYSVIDLNESVDTSLETTNPEFKPQLL